MTRLLQIAVLSVAIAACSDSHGSVDAGATIDASEDAGRSVDASVGPACAAPVTTPCFMPAVVGSLPADALPIVGVGLQDLLVHDGFATLLYARSAPLLNAHTTWETLTVDQDMNFSDPTTHETLPDDVTNDTRGRGALVSVRPGEIRAEWRTEYRNAVETHGVSITSAGSETLPVVDHDEYESFSYRGLALTNVAGAIVAARTVSDLVLVSTEGATAPIPAHPTDADDLAIAAMDTMHTLVVWNELAPDEVAGTTRAAILGPDLLLRVSGSIFESGGEGLSVLAIHGEAYVATFERNFGSLTDSRIRIAHVDTTLTRVEQDRALRGWGGFAPSSVSLVQISDQPWIVWRTIDTRYGARLTLYALPLTATACQGTVDRPLEVLADTSPDRGTNQFVVAGGGDSLWVVRSPATGSAALEAYRFERCM